MHSASILNYSTRLVGDHGVVEFATVALCHCRQERASLRSRISQAGNIGIVGFCDATKLLCSAFLIGFGGKGCLDNQRHVLESCR
jgi:hypothetical protein